PLALLQEARVEHAKRLLRDGDWPIIRVVEAVGYADVVSFTRLFARLVGETPAKYRQRQPFVASEGCVLRHRVSGTARRL
ncbi:helix-turn-helix domain-containing protein, partial [Pseudomonas sp.]